MNTQDIYIVSLNGMKSRHSRTDCGGLAKARQCKFCRVGKFLRLIGDGDGNFWSGFGSGLGFAARGRGSGLRTGIAGLGREAFPAGAEARLDRKSVV